jgi:hypothetical protein
MSQNMIRESGASDAITGVYLFVASLLSLAFGSIIYYLHKKDKEHDFELPL